MDLKKEITRLIETLKALLQSCQQLGEVAKKEAAAILANDLNALDACQKDRETLVMQMRSGERARREAMIPVATFLGERPGDLTVSILAKAVGGTLGEQLSGLANRLRAAMRSVSDGQRTNHVLISHRLAMIRDTLSLIGRIHPSSGGYQPSGMMASEPARGRIVSDSA